MTERIIPVADLRHLPNLPTIPADLTPATGLLADTLARPLRDLRISVTDRCNFRCVYCMPKEIFDKDYHYLPHNSLLSFEEITRITKIFIAHGVEKIRLTGGEPLLRKNIEKLIEMLASLTTLDGRPLDLTMTTNGSLLAKKAQALRDAGLNRITVSLDSMDDAVFKAMNDVDFPVAKVIEGIDAAAAAGFATIKVNMVVKRGLNEMSILPMARFFRERGHILRFIEYMDVGATNGWRLDDVVSAREIVDIISREMPLQPADPNYTGEVAERWRYKDGTGEIGVIASVTQAFCRDCTRARISTEGQLYTCLFATSGHDLRSLLRGGASDEELSAAISKVWTAREDRYSEIRGEHTSPLKKIEMSYIGG